MIIRPCICIPTYEDPDTLKEVLDKCIKNTKLPILVIEQGPDQNLTYLKGEKRLHILSHSKGPSRGQAIQTAINFAVNQGYTHLISIDSKSKFSSATFDALLTQTIQSPWKLIIGSGLSSSSEPVPQSWLTRGLTKLWVKNSDKKLLGNPQSNLRVYPLFFIQTINCWTKGPLFDFELLVRLHWKKVAVTEIMVPDYFSPQPNASKGLRGFADKIKIALLEFWLILLSLIKEHKSPKEASLAMGTGVFVGCTPFFGLHTPIVFFISIVFRMNLLFLWIGSQISIPPLAPFLAFASINIGLWVMNAPFAISRDNWSINAAMEFFKYWLIGSLILGVVFSLATMICTYFLSKSFMKGEGSQKTWQGKIRGGKWGHAAIKNILRFLGLKTTSKLLYFIVPYFYLFAPKARRASLEYWKIVEPELNFFTRRLRVFRHLYRYGIILLEQAYKNSGSMDNIEMKSVGFENIQAFSHGTHGGMLLGAHVGAWNMALSLLPEMDRQNPFVFLQFESSGLTLNKAHSHQTKFQPTFFYINEKENPIFDIYGLLKDKKIIGIMGDRPLGKDYELVPFFGKLAIFDKTPFLISAIAKTPMLTSFGFWNSLNSYNFSASPLRYFDFNKEMNRQEQVYLWLEEYVSTLETALKGHLDQWFNFFPFWSEKPVSPHSIKTKQERNYLCPELDIRPGHLSESESVETKAS